MSLKDKVLGFFGLGYEELTTDQTLYNEVSKAIPNVRPDITKEMLLDIDLTPIENLIAHHDPAFNDLWILKTPGQKLRHIRKARKLTQSQLGEMARVSESTIGDIETGRYKSTSLTTACDIARQLGVEVEDIWSTVLNK